MSNNAPIAVDFDALSKDAVLWDETSERIALLRSALAKVPVRASAFSFAGGAVFERYNTLREALFDLLGSGITETQRLADTLRDVRRDYENQEQQNQEELWRLWHPVE